MTTPPSDHPSCGAPRPGHSARTLLAFGAALAAAVLAGLGPTAAMDDRRDVRVTLLHTNDVHGRVCPETDEGGLARVATVVRSIRAHVPNVLMLDGGDIIHGTPEEKAFGGKPVLSAMNALGYDAAVAGNHEFDFGQPVTRAAFRHARFPVLSANVRDARTGRPWDRLRPYIVREMEGVRVAVFGLTTPTTVNIQWPKTIAGILFTDPIGTAQELVPRLRAQERADVVVALTHLGEKADRELAAAVPGIDFIIGGHSHTVLPKQVWVGETLIAQTGSYGRYLGRIDFRVRRAEGEPSRLVSINGRDARWWSDPEHAREPAEQRPQAPLIPIGKTVAPDPQVVAAYMPYADRLRPALDEVLTSAVEALPSEGSTRAETALGSLLADAVRAHAKAEIALFSAAHVEGVLGPGEIRTRDLYRVMGAYTRQHIVRVRAPGAAVERLLHRAVAPGQLRVQVSGLRVEPGRVTVADEPLDPARAYHVAGPAHILQEYLLKEPGVEVLEDDAASPTVRDAAIEHLRGHAPLRNRIDGRLTFAPPQP